MLCHATLCDPETSEDRSYIIRQQAVRKYSRIRKAGLVRTMFGMQTVPGIILPDKSDRNSDAEGKIVMFFIFSDLSVRIQGDYRLSIRMVDLNRYQRKLILGLESILIILS